VATGITAEEVGQLVSFIAPGYVARWAYMSRFPHRELPEFSMVVATVVTSLPLVAIAGALASLIGIGDTKVTDLRYVALLLGISWVAGYAVGAVRGSPRIRQLLVRVGLIYQPEGSIYAQTLLGLPPEATVTIEFTDGRKLSGTPKLGPGLAGEGIDELYVTHPAWWNPATASWSESGAGAGVIVPLANVHSVTLDRDPT
jgi:hypothetical protein